MLRQTRVADPFARDEPPDLRASRRARIAGLIAAALIHLLFMAALSVRPRPAMDEPAAMPPLQISLHDARSRSAAPAFAFDIRPDAPRTEIAPPDFEMGPEPMPVPPSPPAAAPAAAPAGPVTSTRADAPRPACWPYRWLLGVSRSIESELRHPRNARGERGTAFVRISVERDGRIVEAPLLRSSGHPRLDAEARDVFVRIGRFEPVAPGDCAGYAVIVVDQPVRFGGR